MIPNDVRQAESIDSLKRKLTSFYFKRLFNVFDGDNFRTFKMFCPKFRRVNTLALVRGPITKYLVYKLIFWERVGLELKPSRGKMSYCFCSGTALYKSLNTNVI